MSIEFYLDGDAVEVQQDDLSLLDALREELGVKSVKDGCSPQGQCGCCTVLVDGAARVACVTPVRRVAGRSIVTVDGLDTVTRDRLIGSFLAHGASQCGFCTPGILCRLAALGPDPTVEQAESALLAHLCRCTGWRTIVDAATSAAPATAPPAAAPAAAPPAEARAYGGSDQRAALEGGAAQRGGPATVAGRAGFADDTAPSGCAVAVPADPSTGTGDSGPDRDLPDGTVAAAGLTWVIADSLPEARSRSGKVQGRRSGQEITHPLDLPPGDWALTLQTTWVEPAYLEPDSSWCQPGGQPASPFANGGAFGAKTHSVAPRAARELADRLGRPVRVVLSREDVVRLGPKRPPVAAGLRADGTGVMRIVAPRSALEAEQLERDVSRVAPGLTVEWATVAGPSVSGAIRGAAWAEAAVLVAAGRALSAGVTPGGPVAEVEVALPGGSRARAAVRVDDTGWPVDVQVEVGCGEPLDETMLRSYVTGACHMALGWVCAEAIAVGGDGIPEDLTIRSFGVLRAKDTPPIRVAIGDGGGEAVNGSDAAFVGVAAATWLAQGLPSRWPTRRGGRR